MLAPLKIPEIKSKCEEIASSRDLFPLRGKIKKGAV